MFTFSPYGTITERILGFALFLGLAWHVVLKPAWFGLNQLLGWVDPLSEAMAGIRVGLQGLFADLKILAKASTPELMVKVTAQTLEDLFSGKTTEAAVDAAILISHGRTTYQTFQDQWAPHLEALDGYSAQKLVTVVHGFWCWLQEPVVASVLRAAGRRFALGEDAAEARRLKLKELLDQCAPSLAHG